MGKAFLNESKEQTSLDSIATMLNKADSYNLTVEVVNTYGEARARGSSIREAVTIALQEWDL